MANNYFQFKKFKVEQGLASMKVCTEACIFGALAEVENAERILDIGAGTGVLSLMLAQKTNCPIDAVEIEDDAYRQAKINFENSVWNKRLRVFYSSIQSYTLSSLPIYDLIICNPPFFTNHMVAADAGRRMALHNQHLSQVALVESIKKLLAKEGTCWILLPPSESQTFDVNMQEKGFYIYQRTTIFNKENGSPFRHITQYGTHKVPGKTGKLIIKTANGNYTEEFIKLLSPYYLYL